MSFILKLIKGLGLLGGLFALMYAGLLVLTGPVPRYNIIVPEVTDDLVRFCNENAGVRVFRPLEGVKSISSDIGSICLRRHKRFFLSSSSLIIVTISANSSSFGSTTSPHLLPLFFSMAFLSAPINRITLNFWIKLLYFL